MGQKTNPKAFRLVTLEKHSSIWYANNHLYSSLTKEDQAVQKIIYNFLGNFLSVAKIIISRVNSATEIQVHCLHPRIKEMQYELERFFSQKSLAKLQPSSLIDNFSKINILAKLRLKFLVKKTLSSLNQELRQDFKLSFIFHKNPFQNGCLIANYIKQQLEARISFRRVMNTCLKKAKNCSLVKGVKIQLSGRLNGIEMARTEWKREGKIPLHTLSSKIDYATQEALTADGLIGIKVWLFLKKSKKNA